MKPKLRSLELHGYKTFAGRALFEFPGNITAIVGPNGSGKSNIADAVRWVLGEQSYTLLRGKKTEDMIFLGSDQRPKAGMASATITFNNEEGWLPIDYSEVAVARRAYRDGSNEYLLNRQRVRLKDTTELLAQSGLAERTYTIIGQGLVDAALSLRPEERRKFFEEAAGIGLFRSRREEAITRLDATRRNLERVTDILGELEPRLRSLERQAKRVEEYDQVKDDLQVLLKDWYGFHWQNTQKELLRNREVLKNQEIKVEAARTRRGEIEVKVDAARLRLQELRSLLNAWHMETAELHRQREKISRDIAVLEERFRAYQNQDISLKAELSRNEDLKHSNQEKLTALMDEEERINLELAQCAEQLEEIRISFDERKANRDQLETKINLARKQLLEVETRQVQLKAHQRELTGRVESFEDSRKNLLQSIDQNQNGLNKTQKEMEEISAGQVKIQQSADIYVRDIGIAEEKLAELELQEKEFSGEISRLEAEHARAKAQLEVLHQAELAFSGLSEGARSLLTAASQGKIPAGLRTLSSYLDVPYELETAMSAALGDQLDAVLFGEGVDPERILSYLENDESGRAMLIPLTAAGKGQARKFAGPGILGVASDLVKPSDLNRGLVNFLLGSVIIVNDRATARRLLKDLPVDGRIVTLKGEVFDGSGVIIAGKENRAGIISRPREKKDLTQQVNRVAEKLAEKKKELEEHQKNIISLRNEKSELDKAAREEQAKLQQINATLAGREREVAKLMQQLEWQNNQINTLVSQAKSAEMDMDGIGKEIAANENAIIELNQTIRQDNEQLRGIPIDEIQQQLVHWNTTQAVTERALREVAGRVNESKQTIAQNQAVIEQVNRRIEEVVTATAEVRASIEESKKAEGLVNLSLDEFSQKINPAESELRKLESEYSELQHEYSQTQQFEANADRVYTQAQLEYSRSREALEGLRRRIEEDFGLVTLEYSDEVTGPTPLPLEGVGTLVVLDELPKGLEDSINRQRALLRRMGAINPEARKEYQEVKERHDFMKTQLADLQKADSDLRQIITELDELMHRQFRTTFNEVAAEFKEMFSRLFGGGSARLVMTDTENPTETGIDIEARLPGRREQGLSLLSGGERSLTAVALIFSLLRVSPTPFCILDEVDAMLDEANVGRFTELLKELSQETQFIVITHNRNTVQVADVIYGVTMGRDSASQVISLRLDELSDEMVK